MQSGRLVVISISKIPSCPTDSTAVPVRVSFSARLRSSTFRSTNSRTHVGEIFICENQNQFLPPRRRARQQCFQLDDEVRTHVTFNRQSSIFNRQFSPRPLRLGGRTWFYALPIVNH